MDQKSKLNPNLGQVSIHIHDRIIKRGVAIWISGISKMFDLRFEIQIVEVP